MPRGSKTLGNHGQVLIPKARHFGRAVCPDVFPFPLEHSQVFFSVTALYQCHHVHPSIVLLISVDHVETVPWFLGCLIDLSSSIAYFPMVAHIRCPHLLLFSLWLTPRRCHVVP